MAASVIDKKLIRITTVPSSLKVLLKKQLKFMSGHLEVIAVSSPGTDLDEVEQMEGVRTVAIPMSRSITPLSDMQALWRLYRLIRKERPLIVHTHTPKAGLLGMISAKLAGVPVRMHTVAGLPLMEAGYWKRKLLSLAESLTYRCATKVYPNSANLAEYILNHKFCTPGKLKVLGYGSSNGIDTSHFKIDNKIVDSAQCLQKKHGISTDDFIFLFIGRIVRDKGINELIAAFEQLSKKYTNIKLLLVGPFENDLNPIDDNSLKMIYVRSKRSYPVLIKSFLDKFHFFSTHMRS